MIRQLMPWLVAVLLAVGDGPAQAQTPQPAGSPGTGTKVGVAAFGGADFYSMSATRSFNAVLGTTQLKGYGGGVRVKNLWRGLFVRGGFSTTSKSGQRVFVSGSQVYKLGIPLKVTLTPIEISGGWRVEVSKGRVAPYGGGGLLLVGYKETSDFAESGEDLSKSYKGYVAFGGLEFFLLRWLGVAAEGQYRGANNALGAGGVSAEFGEKSLGGGAFRLLVLVGH